MATERKVGKNPALGAAYGADNKAMRFDEGKTRFDLLPFDALQVLAQVYTKGAEKYAPRNWERGMAFSRCLGSLMRHITAWQTGEDVDKETGLPHMALAAWNCMALLTYGIRGIGEDDRPNSQVRESPYDRPNSQVRESPYERIVRLLNEEFRAEEVAKENKAASRAELTALEKGKFLHMFLLDDDLIGSLFSEPVMKEVKIGSIVVLHNKHGLYRILADLGLGKFSACRVIKTFESEVRGAIEVIHLRDIADVRPCAS